MALWGNNDNVGSAGTVSLNYGTGVVTGSGTSFGIDGGCSEGDVIRFGTRGSGNTYYGDAVIKSIIELQIVHEKPIGLGIIGPGAEPEHIEPRLEPHSRAAITAVAVMLGGEHS